MDIETLHKDIITALPLDSESSTALQFANDPDKPRWLLSNDGLLQLDDRIYVPNHSDLRLKVLQYFHDHPLSGHFGQNQTLKTKHSKQYADNTPGQRFENSYVIMLVLAQLVAGINLADIALTVYLNRYRFRSGHGIPYPWIS